MTEPAAAADSGAETISRLAEDSLRTAFRSSIWDPFAEAVDRYGLISPGDRIAVCISGGKDSMLLAKLMALWQREQQVPFELTCLVMDPGYREENRKQVEDNCRRLGIPYTLFESRIFDVIGAEEKNPCFLCAKMRRGCLYSKARELGCNKIALGHHFNDVIETTLLAMFYGGQLQAMPPKLQAQHFPGMSLIRPLYLVHEEDIIAWRDANGLSFIRCACRLTEKQEADGTNSASKRQEVKLLLRRLRRQDPEVEQHVFDSVHHLLLDTMPGWKTDGVQVSLADRLKE